jgi:hypothetical protein
MADPFIFYLIFLALVEGRRARIWGLRNRANSLALAPPVMQYAQTVQAEPKSAKRVDPAVELCVYLINGRSLS